MYGGIMNQEEEKKTAKRKVEISEVGYLKLTEFMAKLNSSVSGKVRVPDVLEFAVGKLKDSDVEPIQDSYFSPEDKIELILHKENLARDGAPLTREQLLASMLNAYQKAEAPKSSKAPSKSKE